MQLSKGRNSSTSVIIGTGVACYMATKTLKTGDRVEWDTPQGKTVGRVEKKLTSATKIKSHKVAASKSNPEYLVKSEKSGKRAAHKPGELRKVNK